MRKGDGINDPEAQRFMAEVRASMLELDRQAGRRERLWWTYGASMTLTLTAIAWLAGLL